MVANRVEDREEEEECRRYRGFARGGIPNREGGECKKGKNAEWRKWEQVNGQYSGVVPRPLTMMDGSVLS